MKSGRGDVVLVSFPFASAAGAKLRPALVVQSDHNNRRLANTILVQITTNTSRADKEATQVLVDPATPAGQSSGLLSRSAITCENIATVDSSKVLRKIGDLSAALMQQVNDALKASLALT